MSNQYIINRKPKFLYSTESAVKSLVHYTCTDSFRGIASRTVLADAFADSAAFDTGRADGVSDSGRFTSDSAFFCGLNILYTLPHKLQTCHQYPGWAKKPDCFWDQITLQRLMIERRVICQKFQNFVFFSSISDEKWEQELSYRKHRASAAHTIRWGYL